MLANIVKELTPSSSSDFFRPLRLEGKRCLNIQDIVRVSRFKVRTVLSLTETQERKIRKVYETMLAQVQGGEAIYGTTTSYGGRASLVLNKGTAAKNLSDARKLSRAIMHVDVSTGEAVPKDVVRGAILIRVSSLLAGHSAVRLSTIKLLNSLLYKNITPIVGRYGSVGASGDLAQNGRVLACLLHERHVSVFDENDKIVKARRLLKKEGLAKLNLDPKEGLALVNGDNFSTSAAALLIHDLSALFLLNLACSALTIQVLRGSRRNYHRLLSDLRQHPGQVFVSRLLSSLLESSKLARQDNSEHEMRKNGEPVQDPYSVRCLPQYYGPDCENLGAIWETVVVNANSVSDNPLWTTPGHITPGEKPYKWVSGGNFLAMHMADAIDKMRKICVHIIKQNDRHLARLVHPAFNNGLTANLSDKSSIGQSVFKGIQTQMGMFEVYSTHLANPITTVFGSHEEFNQDITSHAFTSAIMAWELMGLVRYSIASGFISACQAVDMLGGEKMLSTNTRYLYRWLRKRVPYVKKEQSLSYHLENVAKELSDGDLIKYLRKTIDNVKS